MQVRHIFKNQINRYTLTVCYKGSKFCYYRVSKQRNILQVEKYFRSRPDFIFASLFLQDEAGIRLKRLYYFNRIGFSKICS